MTAVKLNLIGAKKDLIDLPVSRVINAVAHFRAVAAVFLLHWTATSGHSCLPEPTLRS
jgi:hypothetical protein